MLAARTAQKPRVKVQHGGIAVWNAGPWLDEIAWADLERHWCDVGQFQQVREPRLSRPERSNEDHAGKICSGFAENLPENGEGGERIRQKAGPWKRQRVDRPGPRVGHGRDIDRQAVVELCGKEVDHWPEPPEPQRTQNSVREGPFCGEHRVGAAEGIGHDVEDSGYMPCREGDRT